MRIIRLKEKINIDTPYTLKFDDFIVAPVYDCSYTDDSRKWPRTTPLTKNAERGILDLCSYENNYDLQDMFSRFERPLRDLEGVEDVDFETRLDGDQICYDLRLSIWPKEFMTADGSALSGKKLLIFKKELVKLFTKYFPFAILPNDLPDFMFEDLSGLLVTDDYDDEVYQTYCIKNFELNGKSYLNDTIGEIIRYGFVADMKKAGFYLDSEN